MADSTSQIAELIHKELDSRHCDLAETDEETFEETQEVVTEEVETPLEAEVVVDNENGDDAQPTEETVS